MSSVWKHPHSPNWTARYKDASGKWVNRSTCVTNKAEAQRIAGSWETDAARDRVRRIADVSTAGISDAISRAERLARSGRLDATAARRIIDDLLIAAGQDATTTVTSRGFFDTWCATKAGTVKPVTATRYKMRCDLWIDHLGKRADKPIETITKADAVGFRTQLSADGLSASTANQIVSIVHGVYESALNDGAIDRNPFGGLDSLKESAEDIGREPFTPAEVAALIAKTEGDWRGLVILAATSGLRLMDAARVRWSAVDLNIGLIKLKTTKTGAKLTLPIHPALNVWLRSRVSGTSSVQVFPSLAEIKGGGSKGLSAQFAALMKAAGVEHGVSRVRVGKGKGRNTSKKSFHSFRHFAASQLAAAGVRGDVARQITGHSTEKAHTGYVTSDIGTLRAAVESITLRASQD